MPRTTSGIDLHDPRPRTCDMYRRCGLHTAVGQRFLVNREPVDAVEIDAEQTGRNQILRGDPGLFRPESPGSPHLSGQGSQAFVIYPHACGHASRQSDVDILYTA